MFEKWEFQLVYRLGELIQGIGSIIKEWADKRIQRLDSERRAMFKRREPPPAKPE